MKSRISGGFRRRYRALSPDQQRAALAAYQELKENEGLGRLRFKRIGSQAGTWTIRIGRDLRAIGEEQAGTVTWFWIGSHQDYERLLNR